MTLTQLKDKLVNKPVSIEFHEVITLIDDSYAFTATEFKNGDITNAPKQNNGSCKLFAFAKMHHFSKEDTLACFGVYYNKYVLEAPQGDDHQNIRNFMKYGWDGISFASAPLQEK